MRWETYAAATNCYYFPHISTPNGLPQTLGQLQLNRPPFKIKFRVFSGVAPNTMPVVPSRRQPSRAPGSNPTLSASFSSHLLGAHALERRTISSVAAIHRGSGPQLTNSVP